jgi:hypothetical protein
MPRSGIWLDRNDTIISKNIRGNRIDIEGRRSRVKRCSPRN